MYVGETDGFEDMDGSFVGSILGAVEEDGMFVGKTDGLEDMDG